MTTASSVGEKPIFHYDLDVFNQIKYYLEEHNHHGLALIARQKGVPPFLRFKVWPALLKSHPFVLLPFIQPDLDEDAGTWSEETTRSSIKSDLRRYIQRLSYSSHRIDHSGDIETQILETLELAVLKFSKKWHKVLKYDASLTWMALNLAEWFPPVANTPWVLCGRDHALASNLLITNVIDDYSEYIDHVPDLAEYMRDLIEDTTMGGLLFYEVYERLVLVLLHCPENARTASHPDPENDFAKLKQRLLLPLNGGTIEARVAYFIYCFRKLMPELALYFSEEQILTRFGSQDDEWLIWWLKFAGLRVWSKFDRGRIWDMLLGWRVANPKRSMKHYFEKLNLLKNVLEKLGPDVFWLVRNDDDDPEDGGEGLDTSSSTDSKPSTEQSNALIGQRMLKNSSFKDLVTELNNKLTMDELLLLLPGLEKTGSDGKLTIPFATLDPQFELILVLLAFLKSKENLLVELDQHEIRQFLSRLPPKLYKSKGKSTIFMLDSDTLATPANLRPLLIPSLNHSLQPSSPASSSPPSASETHMIRNDFKVTDYKVDYMDQVINEAGDLWRKWLWMEMVDDR